MTSKPRTAPAGLTLSVPFYVQVAGGIMGLLTLLLGVIYLVVPPPRPGTLAQRTTIALMEPYLGWAMVGIGAWVVLATVAATARASAHGVAAVVHGAYLVALVVSFLITDPVRPTVASVLSGFALVAHGGASIAYWQRGHR